MADESNGRDHGGNAHGYAWMKKCPNKLRELHSIPNDVAVPEEYERADGDEVFFQQSLPQIARGLKGGKIMWMDENRHRFLANGADDEDGFLTWFHTQCMLDRVIRVGATTVDRHDETIKEEHSIVLYVLDFDVSLVSASDTRYCSWVLVRSLINVTRQDPALESITILGNQARHATFPISPNDMKEFSLHRRNWPFMQSITFGCYEVPSFLYFLLCNRYVYAYIERNWKPVRLTFSGCELVECGFFDNARNHRNKIGNKANGTKDERAIHSIGAPLEFSSCHWLEPGEPLSPNLRQFELLLETGYPKSVSSSDHQPPEVITTGEFEMEPKDPLVIHQMCTIRTTYQNFFQKGLMERPNEHVHFSVFLHDEERLLNMLWASLGAGSGEDEEQALKYLSILYHNELSGWCWDTIMDLLETSAPPTLQYLQLEPSWHRGQSDDVNGEEESQQRRQKRGQDLVELTTSVPSLLEVRVRVDEIDETSLRLMQQKLKENKEQQMET